jgi:DNA uptake protein ComE-like DNA-binding protein
VKKLAATVLAPVLALLIGSPAAAAETTATKAARLDVNTATEEQLKETLGVSDEDARRIVAARPYGKRDDLRDRDVLPAETFEKVKKLIDSIC